METVVNNPKSGEGMGMGLIAGVIISLGVIVLFFVFALPAMRGAEVPQDDNIDVTIKLPAGAGSTDGTSQQ